MTGMAFKTAIEQTEEPKDEELIRLVARGDRQAFSVLAERYMNMLYSLARRMSPTESQAEDIVQEALLRIWEKAALWKENGGASVKTWAYRVTYNLAVDWHRKTKKEFYGSVPDENLVEPGENAEKAMQKAQTGKIVAEQIQSLPERQQTALVLTYYEGLSNAEVAEVMGTSVKGVEALLVRARKQMHKKLEKLEGVL